MGTSIIQIARYWQENSQIDETELNFDWSDADTHCWNCGDCKKNKSSINRLERCHIIPKSKGGVDIPSNYVLLCSSCHSEAPNTISVDDMWDWIKSNRLDFAFYGTYTIQMGLKMFEQKEGVCFFDKIGDNKNMITLLIHRVSESGTHGTKINASTYYFAMKGLLKEYQIN